MFLFPSGIIVDSKSDGIVSILKQMVDAYNSNDASGDSILINATWIEADIDNMCDLIRASKYLRRIHTKRKFLVLTEICDRDVHIEETTHDEYFFI